MMVETFPFIVGSATYADTLVCMYCTYKPKDVKYVPVTMCGEKSGCQRRHRYYTLYIESKMGEKKVSCGGFAEINLSSHHNKAAFFFCMHVRF